MSHFSKSIVFGLFCLVHVFCAFGQESRTIRGRVLEAGTREPLVGAGVYLISEKRGSLTDLEGKFKITIIGDTGLIEFRYAGYESKVIRLDKMTNADLTIELSAQTTREVVITAERSVKEQVARNQMSVENLTIKEAKLLPALFGEVDILKTLQLKPGVQGGGEGFSGLYVRGGGPDQNLMLIDGATVYNPNHLFGLFSVFNSDAVESVELYKGAFPAHFTGRLSSVVDIKMKDAKSDKWVFNGGIGLISSRFSAEGPIIKDKLSVLVAARRTYFDIFTRMYNRSQESNPKYTPIPDYYFQDLNTKITWRPSNRDKVTFTGYIGRDVFTFSRNRFNVVFDWGNTTGNLRWQRDISPDLIWSSNLIVTDYHYTISNKFDSFTFGLTSGIRDYTAKSDLIWTPSRRSQWRTGFSFSHHELDIGRASASSSDGSFNFQAGTSPNARSASVFAGNEYDLTEFLQINSGLAFSGFNQNSEWFGGLEPRISLRYKWTDKISLKANFARMYQYLHLASNSGASLPTDLWYPSNKTVRPQISDQVAGGYSVSLWDDNIFFSNEYYYKTMQRQIDLKDGASFFVNDQLDTVFVFGKGWAYGSEWYLEKKKGRLTGWIGYTLSYTWRQFAEINFGEAFHPRYDRRHDISVVGIYKINDRLNFSATWVYGTGNAVSLPETRFFYQDIVGTQDPRGLFTVVPLVKKRNSYRLEPSHRIDLGLVYRLKPKWGEADLTFSVYNGYNRKNPFFIYFETITENLDGTGQILGFKAKQVSLFPLIPSITYNFRF